jgi:hypothetical protein
MHTVSHIDAISAPHPADRLDPYLIDDRRRYQMMQFAHAGAVLLVDTDGIIRYSSSSSNKLLAIGKTTAEGESLLSLVHRQDILNAMVNLDRIRRCGDTEVSWVSRLRTRNRWEWFKVYATSFRYDRGHRSIAALFVQPLSDA